MLISGYTIPYRGGFVCRCSSKQRCVLLSSTKSKYIALSVCIQKNRYYLGLLRELCEGVDVIYEDNQASILWAAGEGKQNQHVSVRYQIFRQAPGNCKARLEYCLSMEMMVDILTKLLGRRSSEVLQT